MHPALSVIVFTTVSGAGFGLLVWMVALGSAGLIPADPWLGGAGIGLALALAAAGLCASTAHLGHPERAWRALSQWRSSWLSREGVLSLATFPPALVYGAAWADGARPGGAWALAGGLAALLALASLASTGMIYASLKPIQRWSNSWVVPGYLALGLATGAVLLVLLTAIAGATAPAAIAAAAVGMLAGAAIKLGYWRFIDRTASASTPGTATGLGSLGRVRLLEAPHGRDNYLMKEMGFRVARKHAAKLRRIGLAALLVPLPCLAAALVGGAVAIAAAAVAAAAAGLGVLVERWLFFAEARHAVTLFYGADTA